MQLVNHPLMQTAFRFHLEAMTKPSDTHDCNDAVRVAAPLRAKKAP
jgi:hypothetical protein